MACLASRSSTRGALMTWVGVGALVSCACEVELPAAETAESATQDGATLGPESADASSDAPTDTTSESDGTTGDPTSDPCVALPCIDGDIGCRCDAADACAGEAICSAGHCVLADADMMVVPEGEFCMGCDRVLDPVCVSDELPRRSPWLSGFAIDRTEVPQRAYQACVAAGNCARPSNEQSCIGAYDPAARPDHPVGCVRWEDADAYCRWLGKALPTEAQWEKAARGVMGWRYPTGEEDPDCAVANHEPIAGACVGESVKVGSYPEASSPYGVADLAGNVAERVFDWYRPDAYATLDTVDPRGPMQGSARVIRGGSYASPVEDLRAGARDGARAPWATSPGVGFRCAKPWP